MILIYFPSGIIHQDFPGFGTVSIENSLRHINQTIHIDGIDTTTCAADVAWKYVAEQVLELDENGVYLRNADYYDEVTE